MTIVKLTSLINNLSNIVYNENIKIISEKRIQRLVKKIVSLPIPKNKYARRLYVIGSLFLCRIKKKFAPDNSYFSDTFDNMMEKFYQYLPHEIYHNRNNSIRKVPFITHCKKIPFLFVSFDKFMRIVNIQLNEKRDDREQVETQFTLNWRGKNFYYSFTPHHIPISGWIVLKRNLFTAYLHLKEKIEMINNSACEIVKQQFKETNESLINKQMNDITSLNVWPIMDYDCYDFKCRCSDLHYVCQELSLNYLTKQAEKMLRQR